VLANFFKGNRKMPSAVPAKPVTTAATGNATKANATAKPAGGPAGAKEGVKISREEVEQAFAFFDVGNTGVLKPRDLKARLSAFYPHMTNKEYRFLISEPNFTVETLWNLLENNAITNFDPVKEAFRVYDPNNTGFVDVDTLNQIMSRMGYGDMTKEDMDVLIKTADVDGDGRISLEDFRSMLSLNKKD
jgi:Ca2+-binding EF-hand superfamily protein